MRIRTLERSDVRSGFTCGEPSLDAFIERYAWQSQRRHHLGVTYVAVDDASRRVVGYFTAAMASLSPDEVVESPKTTEAPKKTAQTALPNAHVPVPVLRVARLAVDSRVQGVGLGGELLHAALMLALAESGRVGCAGVLVDALSDAVGFYERFGLVPLTVLVGTNPARPRPVPMFLALGVARRGLGLAEGGS